MTDHLIPVNLSIAKKKCKAGEAIFRLQQQTIIIIINKGNDVSWRGLRKVETILICLVTILIKKRLPLVFLYYVEKDIVAIAKWEFHLTSVK